jgi:hypothetical protein
MNSFSLENIDTWVSFYYRNPQPDLIPIFINSLSQEGYLKEETAVEPIMFFLSFIFRDNPHEIANWLSQVLENLSYLEQEIIITAVFLSNTLESQEYLNELSQSNEPDIQDLINSFKDQVPPNIEEIPIENPSILDILWSAFMATGEEKYVIRIISALSKNNSQDVSDQEMIINMAKWSLKSNIKAHEKVRSICIDQLKYQTEEISLILKDIMS